MSQGRLLSNKNAAFVFVAKLLCRFVWVLWFDVVVNVDFGGVQLKKVKETHYLKNIVCRNFK